MKVYKNLLLLTVVLGLAGVLVSALTVYEHVLLEIGKETGLALESGFCKVGAAFNCRKVLGSDWSSLFGIPLGYFGIAFYLMIVGIGITALEKSFIQRATAASAVFFASSLALLSSVALFVVSTVEIGTLCPLCLSTYAINVLLFLTAYFLDRSVTVTERWAIGMAAFLRFPRVLLGRDTTASSSTASSLARIWMVAAVLGFFWMRALPDYLGNQFVAPQAQEKHFEEQEHRALTAWRQAPRQEIPLTLDGGAFSDHFKGDVHAPLTVVEFSDYECPACRASVEALGEVFDEYREKVVLVHRDYPLDNSCNKNIPQEFHRSACLAASLARCAGEQGKFQEVSALLFRHLALESRSDVASVRQTLLTAIEGMGLDRQAVEECLTSGRQLEKIRKDIEEGDRLGLEGTPSYWINGKKLAIVTPVTMRKVFDELLGGSK